MEIIHTKYLWRRQTIKERVHERMEKNYSNNVLRKIKENDELNIVKVYVITNFIKGRVKSFPNTDVYIIDDDDNDDDNDDDSKERFVVFRYNVFG